MAAGIHTLWPLRRLAVAITTTMDNTLLPYTKSIQAPANPSNTIAKSDISHKQVWWEREKNSTTTVKGAGTSESGERGTDITLIPPKVEAIQITRDARLPLLQSALRLQASPRTRYTSAANPGHGQPIHTPLPRTMKTITQDESWRVQHSLPVLPVLPRTRSANAESPERARRAHGAALLTESILTLNTILNTARLGWRLQH